MLRALPKRRTGTATDVPSSIGLGHRTPDLPAVASSRSVLHPVTLGADLHERGIGLHVIEQGIATSTMEGRAMFGMLSVLAELLMLTENPSSATT